MNSSLRHHIRDPHTRPRFRILWRWPNATYLIPLFLWILDHPSPIHSPIHASTDLSHHLWTRYSLDVTLRFKNSTVGEAVTNSCRLGQHSDARARKKCRWVKFGLLMKSCRQSRAPRTSCSRIMSRSRLMTNFSLEVSGPRTIRAVSWKN